MTAAPAGLAERTYLRPVSDSRALVPDLIYVPLIPIHAPLCLIYEHSFLFHMPLFLIYEPLFPIYAPRVSLARAPGLSLNARTAGLPSASSFDESGLTRHMTRMFPLSSMIWLWSLRRALECNGACVRACGPIVQSSSREGGGDRGVTGG
jgi:hypothetical protein